MELLLGDLFKWRPVVNSRVVDQDVDLAEGFFALSKEMFDVYLPGHICPNGNGPAAALGNQVHYSVGSFFAGSIVDHDGSAFGSELFGDLSANSLRSACHDRDFSVQFSIFHCVPFICWFFRNCCIHRLHLCGERIARRPPPLPLLSYPASNAGFSSPNSGFVFSGRTRAGRESRPEFRAQG